MSEKKEPNLLEDFLIIFAIVTLIIIFVASLGNLNIGNKGIVAKEFKDTKEQARRRHEKLKALNDIANHPDYRSLHFEIERNFKYEISPLRAIEILMFETDRQRQRKGTTIVANNSL